MPWGLCAIQVEGQCDNPHIDTHVTPRAANQPVVPMSETDNSYQQEIWLSSCEILRAHETANFCRKFRISCLK